MSSARRRRVRTTIEASPLSVPLDLRLDVLSRLDVTSLLRYGATCKPARRDILSQDFRRHLLALRAEGRCGFDPALLVGFSYRLPEPTAWGDLVAQTCRRQNLRFDATLLESYDPVASRDGLVVLLRRPTDAGQRLHGALSSDGLHVCNALTGRTSRLPPASVVAVSYPHALLDVSDGGRSFQLLAVDSNLRTQTFSSKDRRWGPVVEAHYAAHLPYVSPVYASRAVVIGARIYWLCMLRWEFWTGVTCRRPRDPCVISLDAGSSQATRIELPPKSLDRMRFCQNARDGLMLAPSPDGRLSVLVAENRVISMWTLSGAPPADEAGSSLGSAAARWTRQVVIRRSAIEHEPGPSYSVQFMALGERSGILVLQMDEIGLVQLSLRSKEALVLRRDEAFKRNGRSGLPEPFRLCVHRLIQQLYLRL